MLQSFSLLSHYQIWLFVRINYYGVCVCGAGVIENTIPLYCSQQLNQKLVGTVMENGGPLGF